MFAVSRHWKQALNFIDQASMTIRQLFDIMGACLEVLWSIALEIADKFQGREEV